MNRAFKVMLNGRIRDVSQRTEALCRSAWRSALLTQTPRLCWHQASPEQVQIGQRKSGEQARGVLRQASIANLALRVSRLIGVLGRGGRCNDGRIHDRAG